MRIAALLLVLAAARAVPAQNATDTRLLSQPAVSAAHMAFAYAGDLWSARLDGSDVRRLTIADGDESGPSFSPDGRHVLFTSGRDAWTGSHQQLFLVPVGGGVEEQLAIPTAHARAGDLAPLTTIMDAVQRVGGDVKRLVEGQREVDGALGPQAGVGRVPTPT
jgi:tricorn protease